MVLATCGERLRIGTGVGHRDFADRAGRTSGMIHPPASVRVYVCLTPCDMRKSFDSLQALVREHLSWMRSPDTCLYLRSRRKDRVKILYWDRDGLRCSGASG